MHHFFNLQVSAITNAEPDPTLFKQNGEGCQNSYTAKTYFCRENGFKVLLL